MSFLPTQRFVTKVCYLHSFSHTIRSDNRENSICASVGVYLDVRTFEVFFVFRSPVLRFGYCLMVDRIFCFFCFASFGTLAGSIPRMSFYLYDKYKKKKWGGGRKIKWDREKGDTSAIALNWMHTLF